MIAPPDLGPRPEIGEWSPRDDFDQVSTVATKVAAGQVTGRLAGALAGLAKRDRDVVLLVALAELTHAEVATALGIPYGTVASRLNRARKQLRKALGDVNPLKEAHDG
ncbi:RNA polymerase sigma factor [Streptosporangium subroseum]|uniref:RNA polymerase sigma factor n=1 Tax=Streptosporangium subroseum TaxID=106412 RepID=UPI0034364547